MTKSRMKTLGAILLFVVIFLLIMEAKLKSEIPEEAALRQKLSHIHPAVKAHNKNTTTIGKVKVKRQVFTKKASSRQKPYSSVNTQFQRTNLLQNTSISMTITERKVGEEISMESCTRIFHNDKTEIDKWSHFQATIPTANDLLSDVRYYCNDILHNNYYVSEEEKQFPLAFALSVHNSPYQIYRFLKVIYRPHNVYCIHYDQKSSNSFKKLMNALADCLPNVIIPSKIENVIWGWHTIVDAQLNCMSDLYDLRHQFKWQYVMTLCGKEVPLRTNREMVQALVKLNGSAAMRTHNSQDKERWTYRYKLSEDGSYVMQTNQMLGPVPFNLKIQKYVAYFAISYQFVEYILHDEVSSKLREFMNDTYIMDEQYIATLSAIKGVPGGMNQNLPAEIIPVVSGYIWLHYEDKPRWSNHCSGREIRMICMISIGDLHRINYDPTAEHQTFFHNKFLIEENKLVIDCAEKELIRRNKLEHLQHTNI